MHKDVSVLVGLEPDIARENEEPFCKKKVAANHKPRPHSQKGSLFSRGLKDGTKGTQAVMYELMPLAGRCLTLYLQSPLEFVYFFIDCCYL